MRIPPNAPNPRHNHILSGLPPEIIEALIAQGTWVDVPTSTTFSCPATPPAVVFFPISGVIALMMQSIHEKPLAIQLVGQYGMIGQHTLLSGFTPPYAYWRIVAGQSLLLPCAALQSLRARHRLLNRRLDWAMAMQEAQLAQAVVCQGLHGLYQRLVTVLLTLHNTAPQAQYAMTQTQLSLLLGVRRVSVTLAAQQLQQQGLIAYVRGDLMLLQPHALEALACPCYAIQQAQRLHD